MALADDQRNFDGCRASWTKPGLESARGRVLLNAAKVLGSQNDFVFMETATTQSPFFYAYTLVVKGKVYRGLHHGSLEPEITTGRALQDVLRELPAEDATSLVSARDKYSSDTSCWFVTVKQGSVLQQYGVMAVDLHDGVSVEGAGRRLALILEGLATTAATEK
jgi:hypothetical protein